MCSRSRWHSRLAYQGCRRARGVPRHVRDSFDRLTGVTSVGASARDGWGVEYGLRAQIDGHECRMRPSVSRPSRPAVFETLRIPLRGRDFTRADRQAAGTDSSSSTRRSRADSSPGRRSPSGSGSTFQDWKGLEIIGGQPVIRGRANWTRADALRLLPARGVQGVWSFPPAAYVVRADDAAGRARRKSSAAPRCAARAKRRRSMTPLPMNVSLARMVTTPKVYGATASGFAAVAVMLAALGLFSVLSYSVRSRTRGIRNPHRAWRVAACRPVVGDARRPRNGPGGPRPRTHRAPSYLARFLAGPPLRHHGRAIRRPRRAVAGLFVAVCPSSPRSIRARAARRQGRIL